MSHPRNHGWTDGQQPENGEGPRFCLSAGPGTAQCWAHSRCSKSIGKNGYEGNSRAKPTPHEPSLCPCTDRLDRANVHVCTHTSPRHTRMPQRTHTADTHIDSHVTQLWAHTCTCNRHTQAHTCPHSGARTLPQVPFPVPGQHAL